MPAADAFLASVAVKLGWSDLCHSVWCLRLTECIVSQALRPRLRVVPPHLGNDRKKTEAESVM